MNSCGERDREGGAHRALGVVAFPAQAVLFTETWRSVGISRPIAPYRMCCAVTLLHGMLHCTPLYHTVYGGVLCFPRTALHPLGLFVERGKS